MMPEAGAAELRRHLAAAPERVFAAFADAGMLRRWLTPSPDIAVDVLAFDFRPGGGYRLAYHVPGGDVMTVNGTYSAIEPPSRIVFTWNIEPPDEHAGTRSEVTVTIAPQDTGSELHILHTRLAMAGSSERHREGWRGAIDQLSGLLGVST